MAIASKRRFRSILSRSSRTSSKTPSSSSYSILPDDSGEAPMRKPPPAFSEPNPISVTVTVETTTDATPELECVNGAEIQSDKVIEDIDIRTNDGQDVHVEEEKEEVQAKEEKVSEDHNVFEATRRAAIQMVQSASSMTDMMAKTLASKSITPETATATATATAMPAATVPQEPIRVMTIAGEEKIEVEMDDTDFERELHKRVEEACRWGNTLVESGKERVDTALTKTHEAASDLVENSLSLGEAVMVSTETCSRAAFVDGLPLSPVLEQTSERLESAYESAVAEVQEFLLEHWSMLKDYVVARYYNTTHTGPRKPRVAVPDDTVLRVAIEVRYKATE